ncbi:hypothetical protein H4R21_001212 [Coemansia helicoidea]|uniref:Uncharacterized protein n=1 Tax=Coemansia helicoidea TaxID=1286919 RepID=A0ACC1LDQ5_9FUNG|nr:hypothetical protein H4R21_001212 [Coemansia helicoidea]
MEGRLADFAQRLRAEQGKVRRLEHRTASLEAQMRSIKHTMLSVFQQAAFELERLVDNEPSLPDARAGDEAASRLLPTSAPPTAGRKQEPNGRARCPDSPELGPIGRAPQAGGGSAVTEDGQLEDDRISLFPSEEERERPRQPRVDPVSGQTLYGDLESEGPLMHFDPKGWLVGDGAKVKQDPDAPKGADLRHTIDSVRRRARSQSPGQDATQGATPTHARGNGAAVEPSKRQRSPTRHRPQTRSPSRQRPRTGSRDRGHTGSRDRERTDSRDRRRPSSRSPNRRRPLSPQNYQKYGGGADDRRETVLGTDPNGWNVDNGNTTGWVVNSFAAEAEMPVMQRSITQIAEKTVEPTVTDKVMEWDNSGAAANGGGIPLDLLSGRSSGEPQVKMEDAGGGADLRAGMSSDSDDDDDPLSTLRSNEHRAGAASQLTDESGLQLTSERLGPLWGLFGWLPLDELPKHYEKAYGTQLWTPETRGRIRRDIRFVSGLSMWSAPGGPLLFRNGAHLANTRRSQVLFVCPLVPEPLLFFFVVTTVLRTLRPGQGDTVAMLWEGRFKKSPLGLCTATLSNQDGEIKWTEMGPLWSAALDWLCNLGRVTVRYGRAYLRDKIGGWSYDSFGNGAPSAAPSGPAEPAAELVYGLRREDLNALLDVSPMLLGAMFDERELLRLEDELQS